VQRIELWELEPIEVRSFDLARHVTLTFPKEIFGDERCCGSRGESTRELPLCQYTG
jgi:hypothetical protein